MKLNLTISKNNINLNTAFSIAIVTAFSLYWCTESPRFTFNLAIDITIIIISFSFSLFSYCSLLGAMVKFRSSLCGGLDEHAPFSVGELLGRIGRYVLVGRDVLQLLCFEVSKLVSVPVLFSLFLHPVDWDVALSYFSSTMPAHMPTCAPPWEWPNPLKL